MSEKTELRNLLDRYAEVSQEIAKHPWMRNNNAPIGDLAEHLVAEALGGEVAENNAKSHDVELANGQLIQVKGITYRGRNSLFTSAIRSLDFHSVAIVICNPDFSIREGLLVPQPKVIEVSRLNKRMGAYQISVNKARPVSLDFTGELRSVWH